MKKSIFTLTLLSIIFVFAGCDDDDNCTCTRDIYGKWEVEGFMSVESVAYSKDNNYTPVIEFYNDGTINIVLDVNLCFSDFELGEESSMTISAGGCTKICCDSDFSKKFMEMLPQVSTYEIENDELKLKVSGWGWIQLKFVSD